MMPSKSSLQNWCARRLHLLNMEKALFKLPNQIQLEVLLTLGASAKLLTKSEVYRSVDATEVAVRMHLKMMQADHLILALSSETDRRVEKLALTAQAQKILQECKDADETWMTSHT